MTINIELLENGAIDLDMDDDDNADYVLEEGAEAKKVLPIDRIDSNWSDSDDLPLATIRVTIEDTGIGLSKEARDLLFQPFKQAQRLAGGTGLGLFSLSKRTEALGNPYYTFIIPLLYSYCTLIIPLLSPDIRSFDDCNFDNRIFNKLFLIIVYRWITGG